VKIVFLAHTTHKTQNHCDILDIFFANRVEMDHLKQQQRKVLQTSNFARQFNFPVPGRTSIFVNGGGIDDERSSL
jgi:hypothetical protein